jgi:hypothetical protein
MLWWWVVTWNWIYDPRYTSSSGVARWLARRWRLLLLLLLSSWLWFEARWWACVVCWCTDKSRDFTPLRLPYLVYNQFLLTFESNYTQKKNPIVPRALVCLFAEPHPYLESDHKYVYTLQIFLEKEHLLSLVVNGTLLWGHEVFGSILIVYTL